MDKFIHPELLDGEILLSNLHKKAYVNLRYKTKRAGRIPYCIDGSDYPFYKEDGIIPVFVQKVEMGELLGKKII